MWPEVFDRLQRRRFRRVIGLCVMLAIMAVMLGYWLKIDSQAEQIQLRMIEHNFHQSASNLRQRWELLDKPEQMEVNGIKFGFTALGWPIALHDGQLDCQKMWNLLATQEGSVAYVNFYAKKEMRSEQYNSCFYQLTGGNWLELFYQRERIRVNGFLTD